MGLVRGAGFILLSTLSAGVAAYAVFAYGFEPLGAMVHPDLRATFLAHPLGIYAHVFGAAVALAIGPLQFWTRLRNTRAALHRALGRIYLGVGVLIGGSAGLYMGFHAFGGAVSRAGFVGLALAWLYTGLRAYLAIRARDVAAHRTWMIRNFALTFAAVMLRLYLPAAMIARLEFEAAYAAIAWLCWVPTLLVAEFIFVRRTARAVLQAP